MNKKLISITLIVLICAIFIFMNIRQEPQYKVIEVFSSDLICVDFNNNDKCDIDEKIKLFGINSFPQKFGKQSKFIEQTYSIKESNSVVLGILAKDYVKKELLNKFVTAKILDNETNKNYKIANIYLNKIDFSQIILKNGWAIGNEKAGYKIYENFSSLKKNIKFSKNFNYQLRNKKNGKIHSLDCKYGRMASDYEIGIYDDVKYKKDYCNYCHKSSKKQKENFYYDTGEIKIYFLDFTKKLKPDKNCKSDGCKILLNKINTSKESIDFAIYGLGNVPQIENALKNAYKRGVKIRFVIDENSNKENLYGRTKYLTANLQNFITDYDNRETQKFNNFIMHNKFFIFDNSSVWTGSSNISETDLSGFNANNIIFISSKEIAKIYKSEFENMYFGKFHTHKAKNLPKTINLSNTKVKVLFSPQNDTISNHLIPIISQAKKYIYIETFIFTHKSLAESLVKAKNRGVDIKIIIDATSASSNYSMVKYLRSKGIKVKIENYAGKMHMKTISIDDKYFISGSMNLTKSGEKYNDENMLFIENKDITIKSKNFFNHLWAEIPNKYLYKYISAESKESKGSCSDGIDNDYNGKTDLEDAKCK